MGMTCGEQPPERGCGRCERRRVGLGITLDLIELIMVAGQVGDARTTALVIVLARAVVLAVRLVDALPRPPH
jgi:hypothetical protein